MSQDANNYGMHHMKR